MASLRIALFTSVAVSLWAAVSADFLHRRNATIGEESSNVAGHAAGAIAEAKSAIKELAAKAQDLDAAADVKHASINITQANANGTALRGSTATAAGTGSRTSAEQRSKTSAEQRGTAVGLLASGEPATSHFLEAKDEGQYGVAKVTASDNRVQGATGLNVTEISEQVAQEYTSATVLRASSLVGIGLEDTHTANVQGDVPKANAVAKGTSSSDTKGNHNSQAAATTKDNKAEHHTKQDASELESSQSADDIDEDSSSEDSEDDDATSSDAESSDDETRSGTDIVESNDEIGSPVEDMDAELDAKFDEDVKADDGVALFQKEAKLFPYASWDDKFDSAGDSATGGTVSAKEKGGAKPSVSSVLAQKSASNATEAAATRKVGIEGEGEDGDEPSGTVFLTTGTGTNDDETDIEEIESGELSFATEANGMVHDSDDDEHYYDAALMSSSDSSADVFDDDSDMWGGEWDAGHDDDTAEAGGDVGEEDDGDDSDPFSHDDDYYGEEYDDDPGL